MVDTIKTRFCPSPTGYVHLGNARTALFNALLASHKQGIFLLRIEDTDLNRSKSEYVTALEEDLRWLGLDWQEGPGHDLGNGPYFQSLRSDVYKTYYAQLEEKKLAYPCFCSEEDLALTRKMQRAAGKPPRYAGTCFNLSAEKIAEKIQKGFRSTLRFHVANDSYVEFEDLVRGVQKFNTNDIGDFIIRRSDGTSPFMFSNAIDDALMGVTHALRGEDHLTNTPRQILILQALNLTPPLYGHISLIMGSDGTPLSKRHGSLGIRDLRETGFFPDAVNNYLARLGHYYEQDVFMTLRELSERFNVNNFGKSPARYDYQQLLRWQQESIACKETLALWEWMGDKTHSLVPPSKKDDFINAVRANVLFPEDAQKYADLFFSTPFSRSCLSSEQQLILQKAGSIFFENAILAVQQKGQDFKEVSDFLKHNLHVKGKQLYQPLRVAVTGELHGPEMGSIFRLLEPSEIVHRFKVAAKCCD